MKRLSLLLLGYVLLLGSVLFPGSERAIAKFTTSLEGRTPFQRQNISRGAALLDGAVIGPGQVFSFLQAVPVTTHEGFVPAPAILAGRIRHEIGGGICQLSSTLYNAAIRGDLEIVERHPHLFPPLSVPAGFDATVAHGSFDLKMRNRYPFPVTIEAALSGNALTVSLRGKRHSTDLLLSRLFHRGAAASGATFSSRSRMIGPPGSPRIEVEAWKGISLKGRETRILLSRDLYWVAGAQ